MRKLLIVFVAFFTLALSGCANPDDNVTRFDTEGGREDAAESTSLETTGSDLEEKPEAEEGSPETTEFTSEESIKNKDESSEIDAEIDELKETQEDKNDEPTENEVEKADQNNSNPEEAISPTSTEAEVSSIDNENKDENNLAEAVIEPEKETILPELNEEKSEAQKESSQSEVTPTEVKVEPVDSNRSRDQELGLTITSFKGNSLETNAAYNLVKGNTPKNTSTIKVNGYQLQKYVPGETNWTYIASVQTKTLNKGENKYSIKAFDKDGNQLDSLSFFINYGEIDSHALPNVGPSLWATILITGGLVFVLKRWEKKKMIGNK